MFILPAKPGIATLRAFWISLHLTVGGVGILLAAAVSSRSLTRVSAALFLSLTLGLFVGQRFLLNAYRRWNRVGLLLGNLGTGWLLRLIFYLLFSVLGRTGSTLDLNTASRFGSMGFVIKRAGTGNFYFEYHEGPSSRRLGWLRICVSWAWGRGRRWFLPVVPLLWLLSILDTQREDALPTNIYTLY